MLRLSIDNENWILIFSPHLTLELKEREEVIKSVTSQGIHWSGFSHGESFIIFHKDIGALILRIERVPSFILTVISVVSRDKWYCVDHAELDSI